MEKIKNQDVLKAACNDSSANTAPTKVKFVAEDQNKAKEATVNKNKKQKFYDFIKQVDQLSNKISRMIIRELRVLGNFIFRTTLFAAALCIIYSFLQDNNPELLMKINDVATNIWESVYTFFQNAFSVFR